MLVKLLSADCVELGTRRHITVWVGGGASPLNRKAKTVELKHADKEAVLIAITPDCRTQNLA